MQLVTKAEYARRRGVSGAAVTQAVKAGRLTLVDGMVNLDTADAEWGANSRPRVNSQPAVKGVTAPADKKKPRHETNDADLVIPPWQDSKAKQAYLDARQSEVELARLLKTLVDEAQVRAEFAKQISAVREAILQLPARLAPVLAAERALSVVQQTLEVELRQALDQFTAAV